MVSSFLAREFGINAAIFTPGTAYAFFQGAPAAEYHDPVWVVLAKALSPILLSALLAAARVVWKASCERKRRGRVARRRAAIRSDISLLTRLMVRVDDRELRAETARQIERLERVLGR